MTSRHPSILDILSHLIYHAMYMATTSTCTCTTSTLHKNSIAKQEETRCKQASSGLCVIETQLPWACQFQGSRSWPRRLSGQPVGGLSQYPSAPFASPAHPLLRLLTQCVFGRFSHDSNLSLNNRSLSMTPNCSVRLERQLVNQESGAHWWEMGRREGRRDD